MINRMSDHDGRILRIVEHKDATAAELGIREVNTGIVIADRARLAEDPTSHFHRLLETGMEEVLA